MSDRNDGWALLEEVIEAADDLKALCEGVMTPRKLQDATHRLADAVTVWRESLDAELPPALRPSEPKLRVVR
jgi:hypothetical protein